jgi:acetyl esterase/lipase
MSSSRSGRGSFAVLAMILLMSGAPARAQVSLLPPDVQQVLAAVGPQWGKALGKNIETTIAAFQPLLKAAPKDGVIVSRNVAYGEDAKQVLDVYQPQGRSEAPVVIYIHGGAYVRGDKDFYGEIYGNIATWFARQGALGINATYRLAPAAKWPSGADDVRAMVKWAKENAAKFGGDPNRIYLVGHSAGATHVASYIFDRSLQPATGPGVSGAVLISGRYRLEYDPADPNGKNMQAYFGEDGSAYPARSPVTHIRDGERVPVFVVITEYDNPGLDVVGAELLAALCARDGACPRFTRQRSTITCRRSRPSIPRTSSWVAKSWNSCSAVAEPVAGDRSYLFQLRGGGNQHFDQLGFRVGVVLEPRRRHVAQIVDRCAHHRGHLWPAASIVVAVEAAPHA